MSNPYSWLTQSMFNEFARDTGLNYQCDKCTKQPKFSYVDTGNDDGYLPRSSSYTTTPQGLVNMAESRHIPAVRVTCFHCGHIDLYSMYSVEQWLSRRAPQTPQNAALGGFGGEGQTNE